MTIVFLDLQHKQIRICSDKTVTILPLNNLNTISKVMPKDVLYVTDAIYSTKQQIIKSISEIIDVQIDNDNYYEQQIKQVKQDYFLKASKGTLMLTGGIAIGSNCFTALSIKDLQNKYKIDIDTNKQIQSMLQLGHLQVIGSIELKRDFLPKNKLDSLDSIIVKGTVDSILDGDQQDDGTGPIQIDLQNEGVRRVGSRQNNQEQMYNGDDN